MASSSLLLPSPAAASAGGPAEWPSPVGYTAALLRLVAALRRLSESHLRTVLGCKDAGMERLPAALAELMKRSELGELKRLANGDLERLYVQLQRWRRSTWTASAACARRAPRP